MDSDNTFVVFYSNYCNHSKIFLTNLKRIDDSLYRSFMKVCVDNNPSVPKAIQSVPTIIVPSHPHPLTDSSVTMWLDTLASQYVSNTQPSISKPSQNNPTTIDSSGPTETDSSGIMPYVSGEMGTQFSDGFSFLDSSPQSSQPIEHQFAFLSTTQPNSNYVPDQQNSATIDRPSAPQVKSDCFESQYEKFTNTRDNDPLIQRPHQRC